MRALLGRLVDACGDNPSAMASRYDRPSRERVPSWLALHVLCPLLVTCLLGFAALAAATFPTPYDIRYRWISSLASARDNPFGHRYLGVGLICVSVLSAPLSWYLFHQVAGHELLRRAGLVLLNAGIGGLLMLGIEATFFANPGPARAIHQVLAALAFAGITSGLGCFSLLAFRNAAPTHLLRRWYACLAGALLLLPPIGAVVCNLVWYITNGDPRLFGSEWPERVAPLVPVSLAFWEWLAIIDLALVMYLTVWMVSRTRG